MRTIKRPVATASFEIGAMIVMDHNLQNIDAIAEVASRIGVKTLCDFVCNPNKADHCRCIPWDLAAAGCVIIAALTSRPECAADR